MRNTVAFIMPLGGPLFLCGSTNGTGGAERQQYLFGCELAKLGYDVWYFVKRSPMIAAVAGAANVSTLPMRSFGGNILWFPVDVVQLLIRLIALRPKWVVVKTAPQFALPVLLARILGIRLIMWGQTSTSFDRAVRGEPFPLRVIRQWAIRKAKLCICQTQEQSRRLKQAFGRDGILIRNITMSGDAQREREDVSKALVPSPYILWVGNATANKRVDVVVELARMIKEHTFAVAMNHGDEAIWKSVEDAAAELPNLVFLGSVDSKEIDGYFAGCQILLHTAIREGFPNVFLQAWQQGKPVVSVNIDPDGVLQQYGLGMCAFADDSHLAMTPMELARELRLCIVNILSSDLNSYNIRCREYVERFHSIEVCVGRLIDVLEKA